jgi:hypothetical protein
MYTIRSPSASLLFSQNTLECAPALGLGESDLELELLPLNVRRTIH